MLFDIFYYAMQDKSAIVNFLLEHYYIEENETLAKQLCEANIQIAYKNREIEVLREAIDMLQTEINEMRNTYHILVNQDGEERLFRRNENNVFVQVEEESIEEVRRRLNFDVESEPESEDDLMSRLLGFSD